jgi:hypothetical protein
MTSTSGLMVRMTSEQAFLVLMLLMTVDDEVLFGSGVFKDGESIVKQFQSKFLAAMIPAARRAELMQLALGTVEED